MHWKPELVDNQDGSVLIVALIVLFLVSVLGMNSLSVTNTELKISGNDRSYKQNFYRAESVIKEAALALDHSDDLYPSSSVLPWLNEGTDPGTRFDPENEAWIISGTDVNAGASAFYTDNKAQLCALRLGVAAGSNLDMSCERKWEYVIYGRSELSSGRVDMAAGYLKKSN